MASESTKFIVLWGLAAVAATGAVVGGGVADREPLIAAARPSPAPEASAPRRSESHPAAPAAAQPRAWPDSPLPPGVSAAEVVVLLHRAGLDAATVAAAGVDVGGAAAIVAAAIETAATLGPALAQADASVASKRAGVDALRGRVVGGLASEDEIVAWSEGRAAADAAAVARDALLDQAFAAAVAPLGEDARARAATVRASAAFRDEVPPAYRVVPRSEESLVALRDALAAERIALSRSRAVPAEVAAHLVQIRSEPAVAAALSSSAANGLVIAQTWAAEAVVPPGQ